MAKWNVLISASSGHIHVNCQPAACPLHLSHLMRLAEANVENSHNCNIVISNLAKSAVLSDILNHPRTDQWITRLYVYSLLSSWKSGPDGRFWLRKTDQLTRTVRTVFLVNIPPLTLDWMQNSQSSTYPQHIRLDVEHLMNRSSIFTSHFNAKSIFRPQFSPND